jgi:hypothetical protein
MVGERALLKLEASEIRPGHDAERGHTQRQARKPTDPNRP